MAQRKATKARAIETSPARQRARRKAKPGRIPAKPVDMGGLEEILGFMLRRAQLAAFQDYGELTEDLGITTAQFSVMRLAHANPGINQTALANALGAVTPRMVFIIDDLERRGLLMRLPSTVDRRSHAIFLTPEGRKLHKALTKRVAKQNDRMIARLRGADPASLLRMLRLLTNPL
jgi:DNA-binding MarR family transcriptional regulator